MSESSYSRDMAFLREHVDVVELTGMGQSRVAVVPAYQGRVITSTFGGADSRSFGWINTNFIASGRADPHLDNWGGEDRFWLGPEGGQFGLWFANDASFDVDHWKTPAGFGKGAFDVTSQGPHSVQMVHQFGVTNYTGTEFQCSLKRTVNCLGGETIARHLQTPISVGLEAVCFESVNVLTNAGSADWIRATGLLSVWILGQFKPLPDGWVIVPFKPGNESELGPPATTDYFSVIPPARCKVTEEYLLLRCDGRFRSKIGISPARATNVAGSYDPTANVLTIVQFDLPANAADLSYVNSLWQIQDDPFAGDVVNSYNDGEPSPGAGQMGPFYEIETSSPAARLGPGESITHTHRTCHFAGPRSTLNDLATKVLGVDLTTI